MRLASTTTWGISIRFSVGVEKSIYCSTRRSVTSWWSKGSLRACISERGIEVDRAKIETIKQLPQPTDIKSLRRFLGHARFYIEDSSRTSPRSPSHWHNFSRRKCHSVLTMIVCKPSRSWRELLSFNHRIGIYYSKSCAMLVIMLSELS
jgi:hypothetical protein